MLFEGVKNDGVKLSEITPFTEHFRPLLQGSFLLPGEIPQNHYRFALFESLQMDYWITPVLPNARNFRWFGSMGKTDRHLPKTSSASFAGCEMVCHSAASIEKSPLLSASAATLATLKKLIQRHQLHQKKNLTTNIHTLACARLMEKLWDWRHS